MSNIQSRFAESSTMKRGQKHLGRVLWPEGTHILRHTGCADLMGRFYTRVPFFTKISLGSLFPKFPNFCFFFFFSFLPCKHLKVVKICLYFEEEKSPHNGFIFLPQWPLENMGRSFEAPAAHQHPNQIWVPPGLYQQEGRGYTVVGPTCGGGLLHLSCISTVVVTGGSMPNDKERIEIRKIVIDQ